MKALQAILASVVALSWTSAEAAPIDISPLRSQKMASGHPTTEWFAYFFEQPRLSVVALSRILDTSKTDFQQFCGTGYGLAMTGGFFKNDDNGLALDGLVIDDGKILNEQAGWDDGGFVWGDLNNSLRISRHDDPPPPNARQAIQTRPFIIEGGKFDQRTERSSRWDRIGIGTATLDGKSGYIVVAAISELSRRKAHRFSEFAEAVFSIAEQNGIEVHDFLALDGAAGPFVSVGATAFYKGAHGKRYVPTILCLN